MNIIDKNIREIEHKVAEILIDTPSHDITLVETNDKGDYIHYTIKKLKNVLGHNFSINIFDFYLINNNKIKIISYAVYPFEKEKIVKYLKKLIRNNKLQKLK